MGKRLRNILAAGVFLLLVLAITTIGNVAPPYEVMHPPYNPEDDGVWYEQNVFGGGEMGDESVVRGRDLDIAVEGFTTEEGLEGWRVEVPGGRALATPAIGEGLVYIGGGFGSYEFYAFDANNGEAEWLFKAGDDGPTAAVYEQGRVAFNTESCILYVLDAQSGDKVWGEWLGDPLMAQPAIIGDRIVMTYPGNDGHHHLTCRKLETGENIWDRTIIGEVISAPVIAEQSVYAACLEGTVYRFDLDDGELLWEKQMNATSAPFVYDGAVYVSQREEGEGEDDYGQLQYEGLARLDVKSGVRENEELWSRRQADYLRHSQNVEGGYYAEQVDADASVGFSYAPETAKLSQGMDNLGWGSVMGIWAFQGSRPVVIDDLSYASQDDIVVCTDIDSGEVNWEYEYKPEGERLGGRLLTPPSVAGDKLYFGTEDGYLLCLSMDDGDEQWRIPVGEPIRFQPAIEGGWLYVGTDRGTLVGLNLNDRSATGWAMWGGSATHN